MHGRVVRPTLLACLLFPALVHAASGQLDIRTAGLTIAPLYNTGSPGNHGPAVILDVWDKTPAAASGLERGDVILAINGHDLAGQNLAEAVKPAMEATAGSEIQVTLLRPSDGMRRIEVKLRATSGWPLRSNPSFETFGYQVPRSWNLEDYTFPLPWATDIAYQGIEDVLFAPDFANHAAPGYHALVWVWWLDGDQTIDSASLREALLRYFRGLTRERAASHGFSPDLNQVNVKVAASPAPRGVEPRRSPLFTGQITTYNPEGQLITLWLEADQPACGSGHTAILFRLATKAQSEPIWADLRTVTESFRCARP